MILARRTLLAGLAGVGLAGLRPEQALADIKIVIVGAVDTATGSSTGELDGRSRDLAVGSPVFIEDRLGTGAGARLALHLGEKTRLSLGERTHVRIDRFLVDRGGDLVLESGAMLFDRPDDPASGTLNLTTPFGLIAARGTKFFAGPSRGAFGVFVEHGLVDVKNAGHSVSLTAGMGTNIAAHDAPPSDPVAWAIERIAEAEASTI